MEKSFLAIALVACSLAAGSSAKECDVGTTCVRLSRCRDLREVARRLGDAGADGATKLRLLEVVRSEMCSGGGKVEVCCREEEIERVEVGGAKEEGEVDGPVVGSFNRLTFHELSGNVVFRGRRKLVVRDFVYDGDAPDAFFVAGTRPVAPGDRIDPSEPGAFALPVEEDEEKQREWNEDGLAVAYGDPDVPILREFDGHRDVVLQLPDGVEVDDIRWISVYCRQYDIDFGHVKFSELPKRS